jgi:DHA1 family bicyclomycin/chloramphenicol resistance-like MFS transporter
VTILVPLLATIADQFRADFGRVQFLVSAYLLGLALAQPFNGFLCDRFGRRPVMLLGFLLFVLSSLLAAFADSLDQLTVLRFMQAVGVSVGTVASRAVVRDTRSPAGAAETLSYIAAAMGFAPILAPMLGGWLGAVAGYRGIFLASAAMGAVLFTWAYARFPETLDPSRARSRWSDWLKNYRKLLGSGSFLAWSSLFGFAQGGFLTFLAVGAAVFRDEFGIDGSRFGMIWGSMAIVYVISSVAGGRLSRRLGPDRLVRYALGVILIGGWLMPALLWQAGVSQAAFLIPLTVLMAAAGCVMPGALAGAVNAHPDIAGTAAGMSSAVGLVMGGSFTVLAGFLYQGDTMTVALLVAVAASLAAATGWGAALSGSRIAPDRPGASA